MDTIDDAVKSGLQGWYTDLDGWVCRFDARLRVSRSHSLPENAVFEHKIPALRQNRQADAQSSQPLTLQEIYVNGLLITKKKYGEFLPRNMDNFLSILNPKDCMGYDFILLTQILEHGRRHLYKSIWSKL